MLTASPTKNPIQTAGNQGVDVICRALRTNAFLRELDISHTPIDDKAANAVAQVWRWSSYEFCTTYAVWACGLIKQAEPFLLLWDSHKRSLPLLPALPGPALVTKPTPNALPKRRCWQPTRVWSGWR